MMRIEIFISDSTYKNTTKNAERHPFSRKLRYFNKKKKEQPHITHTFDLQNPILPTSFQIDYDDNDDYDDRTKIFAYSEERNCHLHQQKCFLVQKNYIMQCDIYITQCIIYKTQCVIHITQCVMKFSVWSSQVYSAVY